MKVHRNVVKHLGIARSILQSKVESWVGREPFPGDPLRAWKAMLADVIFELHDIEPTDEQVSMTPRMRAVLLQYRGLLEEQDQFWNEHSAHQVTKWSEALRSLDMILDKTETNKDPLILPVTTRPDSKCIEFGRCKIKVQNDNKHTTAPQMLDGTWEFGKKDTFGQSRECLTCGRKWETAMFGDRENTIVIAGPDRILL